MAQITTVVMWIQSLAWEILHAVSAAKKKKKKERERERERVEGEKKPYRKRTLCH